MSRIYQGHIGKVEILRIGHWLLVIGSSAKPPHHQLFQDAVIPFSA